VNSGSVVIRGAGSTVASQSTTAPAILVDNSGINLPFSQVSSAVPTGTGQAIRIDATTPNSSTGILSISDRFRVSNLPGTPADVTNNSGVGGVTVTLPPP
jgi:hypothetical protein